MQWQIKTNYSSGNLSCMNINLELVPKNMTTTLVGPFLDLFQYNFEIYYYFFPFLLSNCNCDFNTIFVASGSIIYNVFQPQLCSATICTGSPAVSQFYFNKMLCLFCTTGLVVLNSDFVWRQTISNKNVKVRCWFFPTHIILWVWE